jgi:hypothetical protein
LRRIVADAGVVLSWFQPDGRHRGLRSEYESGALSVVVPRHLVADALALLAADRGWPADRLSEVGRELDRLGLEVSDPPIRHVAKWIAKGLPADRAGYPALAEALELPLATDDEEMRRLATGIPRGD